MTLHILHAPNTSGLCMHVRVNLPIRYMTTGISVLTQLLRDAMGEHVENGVSASDAHKSVSKLLDAELAVMLDAYHAVLSREHTAHSAAPSEVLAHALDASQTTTLRLSVHGDVVFMHGPITVHFECPVSPAHVVGEPDKITQVILNLGRNAIEAIGEHGNIWLKVKRSPKDVSIEVVDDGPGLSEPTAPIFDAFYSTKAHGTGLGLSICQRIVSDHNGTITVQTSDGRTTFRVHLPRLPSTET